MKKTFLFLMVFCGGLFGGGVDWVDPFIGTGTNGHTFPGAVRPFGMTQLGPDNGSSGWGWCSGYHYSDSLIAGFGHTHLSGTGIGDLCDLVFLPFSGELIEDISSYDIKKYRSPFKHENEEASPGYYRVLLLKDSVTVELTTTKRVGIQRYEYQEGGKRRVILDLGYNINWDRPIKTMIHINNEREISGYRFSAGWAKDQRLFFHTVFSEKIVQYRIIADGKEVEGNRSEGVRLFLLLTFDSKQKAPLTVKTALSGVSVEGAEKNLQEEASGWDFEKYRDEARNDWESHLGKIRIEASQDSVKTIFYTALYHSLLCPTLFSDVDGSYRGADRERILKTNKENYTLFSLWDTFRATHPLFTLIEPQKTGYFIQSLLSHYRQQGRLPMWLLHGNDTGTMHGYHGVPVVVDAFLKGIGGFDADLAYEAVKATANQDEKRFKLYRDYGYIPADKENYSVTRTLEYCFDDWCAARMAEKMGKKEDAEEFRKRSQYYRNVFDAETGFMRGKNADSSWVSPFDPSLSDHFNSPYAEGNAWHYLWFAPHDPEGLIELSGGRENFEKKLDSLFEHEGNVVGKNASPDISGLIGQYAHGNEPCHHVAYLYNYTDNPWKTARILTKIMGEMYSDAPEGLAGNEDCGQMSSWHVFTTLGFYPLNPAGGVYELGRPFVEKAVIQAGVKDFVIRAKGLSKENIYTRKIELNGKPLKNRRLLHKDILKGGELVFYMGKSPE